MGVIPTLVLYDKDTERTKYKYLSYPLLAASPRGNQTCDISLFPDHLY